MPWPASVLRRGESVAAETERLVRLRSLPADDSSLERLLAAVADASIGVTREALSRLAQFAGPEAAQQLRSQMWHADPALVGDFAACIAALGDRAAIHEALSVLRGAGRERRSYSERTAALALLGAFADPATAAEIRGALDDPIGAVRRTALVALRRFPADLTTRSAVVRCLGDGDSQVRATAVASVAALCDDAGVHLEPLVVDQSSVVRVALARAAGRLACEPSRRLLADREIRVRELTAQRAGPHAAVPLAQAMCGDSSQSVRQAAARRLGELRAGGATVQLLQALGDQDGLVRVTALRSLELIHGTALPGLLLEALADSTRESRASIVYALGRLGIVDELAAFGEDADPRVRAALGFVARQHDEDEVRE